MRKWWGLPLALAIGVLGGLLWRYLYMSVSTPGLTRAVSDFAQKKVADDFQPQRERYQLLPGEKIKAVISGQVTHIGPVKRAQKVQALNLIISNARTQETVSYLLPDNARIFVKEGRRIRAGRVVAQIQSGGRNLDCLRPANLGVTYLKAGRIVPIDQRRYR